LRYIIAALLAFSTNTYGQTSQPSAQDKFNEAKTLYNIGEFEQALGGFKEAYLLSKAPELLLNIAQCYRFLHRNQEAIHALQSYLAEAPESPYVPQTRKLIEELSYPTTAPSAAIAPPLTQPAALPPTPKEKQRAKREAIAAATTLGVFTGVTGGVFLARNPDLNRVALFTVASTIGTAGGVGLGLLYSNLLHQEGQHPKEVHPLFTGLLLGVGEGLTGSLLLNIDSLGPQATLSATYFSTTTGLLGGVIVSELYDPSAGDSWLVLSGGAWGLFFGEALVGAAQLDLEVVNNLAISGLFNAGILGASAWAWFVDADPTRVLVVDVLGVAGASSGAMIGGLIESSHTEEAKSPRRGASIGGLIGGAAGLTTGFLVSKGRAALRPRLRLVPQSKASFMGVLPVKTADGTTTLQTLWTLD
jgi:hypothetical protein